MPTNSGFAYVIRDWTGLLAACADNAESLQLAEPQRQALAKLLTEVEDLKNRQESLRAAGQEATQKLVAVIREGQEAARRLRGAVKASLGTRSERLVQFKMPPNRPRGPRKSRKPQPAKPPETGGLQAAQPAE